METTFDFNITDNEYTYNVDSTINLQIRKTNNSVAILYFTDELGNKINIPDGLIFIHTIIKQIKKLSKCLFIKFILCVGQTIM
jgi:hypothetical protein